MLCKECYGRGTVRALPCPECGGMGVVSGDLGAVWETVGIPSSLGISTGYKATRVGVLFPEDEESE